MPPSSNKRRSRRRIRWQYGKQSQFKMLVFTGSKWLPPFYSHDVPNKSIARGTRAEYNEAQKIERLQKLFARGGTRGNGFVPAAMNWAVIVPNFGKIADAVALWSPNVGWRSVQPKQPENKSVPGWRLWMAGDPNFNFAADPQCGELGHFAEELTKSRPDLITRFADPVSGEVPQSFFIAAWLASVARQVNTEKRYRCAYLYHGKSEQPVLRVDLGSGRLCGIGQGGAWVTPQFFFTL